MDALQEIKEQIRGLANELLCETHPSVCEMRDNDYPTLERLVIEMIESDNADSVQEAFANIEANF